MSWLSVAEYSFTGTLTSPNETAPFQIARMHPPQVAGLLPCSGPGQTSRYPSGRMAGCVRCSPRGAPAVPTGPGWLHEVKWDGMRVLVRVHDGRVTLVSRNENDVTVVVPRAGRAVPGPGVPGAATCSSTGRSSPSSTAGRCSARWPTASTSGAHAKAEEAAARQPGDADGLRPAAARRRGPHRPAAGAAPGTRWSRCDLDGPQLEGAADVRRRQRAPGGDPGAGTRGHRQQAAVVALRLRPPLRGLAEVPAPALRLVRRRAAGAPRPGRRTGWGRCSWGSRRPTAWCSAAGWAAASREGRR